MRRAAVAAAAALLAAAAAVAQPAPSFRAAQADPEVFEPVETGRPAEGMGPFFDRHRRVTQLIVRSASVHAIANVAPSWRRDRLYRPFDLEIRPVEPGRDFVLVLVSQEPTLWRLALAQGARWPDHVIVAGGYAPRLSGPPRGTPVTALDRVAFRPEPQCRALTREFDACWRRPFDTLDAAVAQLAGEQLDSFQGTKEARRGAAPPERRAWIDAAAKARTRTAWALPAESPTEPPAFEARERPLELGRPAHALALSSAVGGGPSACPGGRYLAARDLCASDDGAVVELPLWSPWLSGRQCTDRFVFLRVRPEREGALRAELVGLGTSGAGGVACSPTESPIGRFALWTGDGIPFRAPVRAVERATFDFQSSGRNCVASDGTTDKLREWVALCGGQQRPLVAIRIDGPIRLRTRAGTWEPLCAQGFARRGGACEWAAR